MVFRSYLNCFVVCLAANCSRDGCDPSDDFGYEKFLLLKFVNFMVQVICCYKSSSKICAGILQCCLVVKMMFF
ncbi:MAG: hypothetical protein LBP59_16020 [Planctomycetaceae bacterium]|nr:hypothetical protein [Planctomycetaceae bacterium]